MSTVSESDTYGRAARYPCHVCKRSFDRRDVLRRHMVTHERDRPLPKSRKKACIPCSRSKIRCLGEQPSCSACNKRSLTCQYAVPRPASQSQHRRMSPSPPSISNDGMVADTPDPGHSAFPDVVESSDSMCRMPQPTSNFSEAAVSTQALNSNSHAPHSDLGPSPSSNSDIMSLLQNTDFNSNLDWLLDPQPDMLPWFDEGGYSMSGNFSNIFGGSFPTFESHLQRITHSVPASPPGNTNLQPAMAPISGLPTPNPREDCGPDDPWPMAWHARKIHRLRLPPLEAPGGFMHKPFFSPHTYISTNILTEMQRLVNMCSVDTEDLELPDASKLNHCIDLYFINFSQVMSIVHRPTFDPRASIVVTLAMVAIGVLYSNFRSAKEYSYSLSELIRKILILMEEYDRRFVRTEDHLTAQILQGFHGYCSGNQRLFELSETSRGSLVTNARRMGLFAKETADDMVHTSTTADIGPAWVDWIRKERLRRIGWGVYLYDAAVSYLHNVRPYLTVAEVTMTLPSMELEWEAESAQSWAALHSRNGGTSHKISLRNLLRSLFDGTPQPLNKFGIASHRGLVVSTLVRMIWTIKELRGNPVHDLVGDASAQDRGDALLPALDMFLESPLANRDLRTQKEVTSLVRRLSLVHIGHLYAAGELMNWLYPLLRRKDSDGSLERRMRQWKTDRPQQVRDATFHAAQILGLARQFADYGPYQVFAVFHAGVVLFYMATLLSEPGETHHGATPDEPPFEHLQLDFLGLPGDEMTVRTARWVDGGHPVVIGLHGVPDLCSEHGRLQLLEKTADMLSQMELVWGVAENLRKVVLRLRDRI